jgi:hypothetical protein
MLRQQQARESQALRQQQKREQAEQWQHSHLKRCI